MKKDGGVLGARAEIHCSAAHGTDHGEAGCPLQSVHGGADIHLQSREDAMPEQGEA